MKTKGKMKVLMVMTYKDYPIYVRQIGDDVFIWDVIIDNQLYSSFMVITPDKGRKKLTKQQVNEVAKMCYAGAAATVDTHLGVELADTDQTVVNMFENARIKDTNAKRQHDTVN